MLANAVSRAIAERSGHRFHLRRRIKPSFRKEVVGAGKDLGISGGGVWVGLDYRAGRNILITYNSTR